jgi:diguanylate cyclase (GGDEF)-like protein
MISLKLSRRESSPETTAPAPPEVRQPEVPDPALQTLREAIGYTRAHALTANPSVGPLFAPRLQELEDSLASHGHTVNLAALSVSLEKHLRDFGSTALKDHETRTEETRELVRLMAETAQSVAKQAHNSSRELNECAGKIERVGQLDSVHAMRSALQEHLTILRESIERESRSQAALVKSLETELTTAREKLHSAETAASVDTLTLLPNRRGFEKAFQNRIRQSTSFTIIVLDLNQFKGINDRYGHLVGDAVLRAFATKLRSAIRPNDVASRWGGDEFVVLLDCPLRDGLPRSRDLHQKVCGRYQLPGPGGEVLVPVSASIGVAEACLGDTLDSLLQRADVQLYKRKKQATSD